MPVSSRDYGRLAIQIVALDRGLARALAAALAKHRPVRRELAVLEAALRDAIADTTVSTEDAAAGTLLEQARAPRTRKGR